MPDVAGHIGKPETVRDAVSLVLRDFGLAYRRSPAEALASRDIYERALHGISPEAIVLGGQRTVEETRGWPSPSVLRKYAMEFHAQLMRMSTPVMPVPIERNGMICHICGAEAIWRNGRLVMEHHREAHNVRNGDA